MYKSTYVSPEAMQQFYPTFSITTKDDRFCAQLTEFSTHTHTISWSNNVVMASPGKLLPPVPVYSDPHDAIVSHLGHAYAYSFIELTPLRLENSINGNGTFVCDSEGATHYFVQIHWPAVSAPSIDDAEFFELCQRLRAFDSKRILPGESDPCGTDLLIIPLATLDVFSPIFKSIHLQEVARLYTADRAWRKYDAEAPFYKARITKMIESSPALDRTFLATDEYALYRSKNYTPGLDLHCRLWYNNETLQRLTYIASGEYRLLNQLFGGLY